MKNKILIAIAAIGILSFSCKSTKSSTKETHVKTMNYDKLQGGWTLESIVVSGTEGKKLSDLFPNKLPTINFDITEQKVFGNNGCNSYNGPLDVRENKSLKIGAEKMATTMMFCEGVDDRSFMRGLGMVTDYKIEGDKLLLIHDGIVIMIFEKSK